NLVVSEGIRPARDFHATAWRGPVEIPPARACLGLRLRKSLKRRRCLRAPAAAQGRRAVRPRVAGDRSRGRLPAPARGAGLSRLPVGLRVTGGFAVAMAAVLAGSGLYLYVRLDSHLAAQLDRELLLRAQDLAAVANTPQPALAKERGGRFIERG